MGWNRSLSLNGTHPVEMGLVQCVNPLKLSWLIKNKVTTKVYLVRWTQRLNNQPKFGWTNCWNFTFSCEGSGSAALDDTLKKYY